MLPLVVSKHQTLSGMCSNATLAQPQPPQHTYICLPGEDKATETGREERGEKRRLSPATWSLSPQSADQQHSIQI
jgi:hypothetical protein